MPGKRQQPGEGTGDAPRTDLQPEKKPYYDEGYFGSEEEEGVVKEREAPEERPDTES